MKRHTALLGTAALVTFASAWTATPAYAPSPLAARAGNQELSAERLAMLCAQLPLVPSKKSIATTLDLWVAYQLLGYAGAHGDALQSDQQLADASMWRDILTRRDIHFYDNLRASFTQPDSTAVAQTYARGDFLAAQHIVFLMPSGGRGLSEHKQDSIRALATSVLKRANPTNFGDLAKQYTDEPGGKGMKGSLGVFARGVMEPAFEAGVVQLRPGQISPALVVTSAGFHIIRRYTLAEVRTQVVKAMMLQSEPVQRDAYVAKLRRDYQLTFRPGAAAKIRSVAGDETPEAARVDNTVIATTRLGPFTAARLNDWIESLPKEKPLGPRLAGAADSTALRLVGELIEQELIDAEARKAGINPDSTEMRVIRDGLPTMVKLAAQPLHIDVASLRTGAATVAAREQLAARRIDVALDKLFDTKNDFVEIPRPLATALRLKYPARINDAALDMVLRRTIAIRAALDSLKPRKHG